MSRVRQVCAAGVLIAALAGCGGGGSSAPSGPGATALSFLHAAGRHDAGTMCDLTAKSELQKIHNLGVSCDAAMTQGTSKDTPDQDHAASQAKVRSVSVHGDHATVTLSDGSSPILVRDGGRWYIQTLVQ